MRACLLDILAAVASLVFTMHKAISQSRIRGVFAALLSMFIAGNYALAADGNGSGVGLAETRQGVWVKISEGLLADSAARDINADSSNSEYDR